MTLLVDIKWTAASFRKFYDKMSTLSRRGFMLKPTERPLVPLGIFKMVPRLRNSNVFVLKSLEVFSVFNTLTLKQFF